MSLETQHENLIAVVRRWEMLAASEVKMSGSTWKRKPTGIQSANSFCENMRHFFRRTRNWKFHGVVAQQRQRNVQKSVLHVQSCFLLITPIVVVDDDHNDNFKKQYRFNDQNNSSARAFSTFL